MNRFRTWSSLIHKLKRLLHKEEIRPTRMYAALRLAKMLHKVDDISYAMALALSIYHVTWDYDNWTDEDDRWFWTELEKDEKEAAEIVGAAVRP